MSGFDFDLKPRSPLAGHMAPGRYGNPAVDAPGVRLAETEPREIVRVSPLRGKKPPTNAALREICELALPAVGKSVEKDGVVIAWVALDAWIVMAEAPGKGALYRTVEEACRGVAAVADQSHGLTGIVVSGPRSRDLLAKGCAVDLHPDAFPSGACAATQMEHIGVHLRHAGEDTFELLVPTSYAVSFWEFLAEMALEFGYEVAGAA